VEQIRNHYDTTPLVDLPNNTEHDSKYGTGQTTRGNLTENVVGDVYSRIRYDITGVVDSYEDGVGNKTEFSEDKQGNRLIAKEMLPDSSAILDTQTMLHLNFKPKVIMPPKSGYMPRLVKSANTVTSKNTDGTYELSVFDDFQRLCVVEKGGKDGIESIVKYEWEHAPGAPLGLCLRASLPYAPGAEPQWVTYEYDALGRPTSRDLLSHGGKESVTYKGNSVTAENARGGWRKLSIDPIGKLRKVKVGNQQEGAVTETDYQYDHQGRLKDAILPRAEGTQKHSFAYDNGGRLVIGERAESGHEGRTYDAAGRLASRTDAKGQRVEYFYDTKRRLSSIKRYDADGQIKPEQCITYYYDTNPFEAVYSQNPDGKMTAAQWGDENSLPGLITEMYSYSPYGSLKAKRLRITRKGRTADIDLNYAYTAEGRISEISYTDGQPLVYECDSMGRQSTLTSGADVLVKDAVYTPAGHLASFQQLVPGTNDYITETRTIGSHCQTHRILAEQSGNPLLDVGYEYSKQDGRLVADNDRLSKERTTYSYDSMGLLKAAKSADKDWEAGYEYDSFGSLTTKKQKNGRGRSFTAKHNAKTNRAQLAQVEYDANGNIINHFGTKLSFDIENRLIEARHNVSGVEVYAYNKDNLRIWKKAPDGAEEFYLYGADNKLLATYRLMEDGKGNISLSLIDSNIYFAKQ
jgi:YD repeat-containing protein